MKKTYAAPAVMLQRFVVSDSVASGNCTTTTTYNPVLINCLKTGSHYIFYDSCTEVTGGVNYNSVSKVQVGDYEYMYWYGNDGLSSGGLNNETLYNYVVSQANLSQNPLAGQLHIAQITTDITSVTNSSL